jgi:hypothetical protein
MVLPGHFGERGFGLWAGRIHHQDVDGSKAVTDGGHELGGLLFVGDVREEHLGVARTGVDGAGDLRRLRVVVRPVDGNGEAVVGQAMGDGASQSSGAAGH